MLEVRIQHRTNVGLGAARHFYNYDDKKAFVQMLQSTCAELFSVDDLRLSPNDFSVYDEPIMSVLCAQEYDIVIRITLHQFRERMVRSEHNAAHLISKVSDFLNKPSAVDFRGKVSVGVSLVYAEIEWAATS